MAVPLRLAAFAVALVAVFGLAFGVGRTTGDPADAGTPTDQDSPHQQMSDADMTDADGAGGFGDGHDDRTSGGNG